MIGPMVAAKDPKIAFVVMLAGPGVPFRQLMPAQRAALNGAMGVPAQVTAANEAMVGPAEAATLGAKDAADAQARIRSALADRHLPPALLEQIVRQVGSPGYLSMLADDGRANLAQLRMPVLALVGSKDRQVPADQNIPGLKAALKDDPQATVMELPNLNHLFQDADKGLVSEYMLNTQTVSPKALQIVGDWVVAHGKS
jgi:pimeloyl-ACP methyl ester carboxylesterase